MMGNHVALRRNYSFNGLVFSILEVMTFTIQN